MRVLTEVDFSQLKPPLAGLFAAAGQQSFFARGDWYNLLVRFASPPGVRPFVYVNDANTAALVCLRDNAHEVRALANVYTMEHGPVLAGAPSEEVGALAAAVAREQPRPALMRWIALDPADPSFCALSDGLRAARWVVRPFFDFGTWFDETRGLDFRTYFDSRPSVLRNTYLRKSRNAPAGLKHRLFLDVQDDLEPLIADYETVYAQSWKQPEPFARFMPELMRLAARLGALRMGSLRLNGVPVAVQFWILWNGRAVIYKLAHDERFKQLSPGTLLTMRLLEAVLERDRPDEINFGRGDDPYKRLWLPRRRERWGLLGSNPRRLRGFVRSARSIAGNLRDRLQHRPPP